MLQVLLAWYGFECCHRLANLPKAASSLNVKIYLFVRHVFITAIWPTCLCYQLCLFYQQCFDEAALEQRKKRTRCERESVCAHGCVCVRVCVLVWVNERVRECIPSWCEWSTFVCADLCLCVCMCVCGSVCE